MDLWQFASLVWGYFIPVVVEWLGKAIHGTWKVILVGIFCLISGFLAGALENGMSYDWSDWGDIFKFAGLVFVASQFAWTNTWKKALTGK